jgi:multiple sugar transport system permease protein/sn-glycerol 3-phosphate transport system permease protein
MTSRLAPYLFVAPAILMVLVFLYLPILVSLALSFSDWNFIRPDARFVGLENYRAVLGDTNFHAALRNTGIYTLILAPLQVVIPLLLARLLVRLGKSRLANFYKSALFLPTIIAFSIAGATWLWLFNPLTGLFNIVLEAAGFAPQRWLEDPKLAIWSVSATVFWKTFGLNMLLFLAAFTAIPPELTEAARIDGARPARILWRIEVPLISPTLFFVIVTTVLGVMDDLLGAVDVMTGGGPIDATTNLLFYLWEKGLRFFQFGHAGATTMIIAALIGFITWAQFKLLERKVHYG